MRPDELRLALNEALGERYSVERELGRGGMGIVFLAWDNQLERSIALKVLPPETANPVRRQRFLAEARIAAQLEHEHIVTIHTVDEAGPFVYFTMKYVDGETLEQRIALKGPLPVGEVARIVRDVARAAEYAHQRGIIHRDLKASNVLLEKDTDHVYVADFGIARVLAEPPFPGGGRTVGTLTYISPEQVASLAPDRRSDVYQLGIMAYEAATGEVPFNGTVRDVLLGHMFLPAPPLRVVGKHLDTTLPEVVGRCLAKDPNERFQTAGHVAARLSLAPELREQMPKPLRKFLARLRATAGWAPVGVLFGVGGCGAMVQALDRAAWGDALDALAFIAALVAMPLAAAVPVTRGLLRDGYARDDIVRALSADLERQQEDLDHPPEKQRDPLTKALWWVFGVAAPLFLLGSTLAYFRVPLPERAILWLIIPPAFAAAGSGFWLWGRYLHRNQLVGDRWAWLYRKWPGAWLTGLSGLGLRAAPKPRRLQPVRVDALPAVVRHAQSWVRRIEAEIAAQSATREQQNRAATNEEMDYVESLELRAAILERLVARITAPGAESSGSLTGDLEAVGAVCLVVQALIEAREVR